MTRRSAGITQADIARAIRAAKQAGAAEVEVRLGDHSRIIIRISPSTNEKIALEEPRDIVL
jgi:DNA-binding MarR family transcriptional regulator